MAEGKMSGTTTAAAAIGSLGVGIVGTYLSMSDTSPKSLEQIAASLSQIVAAMEAVDNVDEGTVQTATQILLSTSEIGEALVEKSTEVELEPLAGVILNEERIKLAFEDSIAIALKGTERVALTFHFSGRNYVQLYVNDALRNFRTGQRVFESDDTGCFLELVEHDREAPSVSMIAVCPPAS